MTTGLDSLDFGLISRPKSLKDMKSSQAAKKASQGELSTPSPALPTRDPSPQRSSASLTTARATSRLEDLALRVASSTLASGTADRSSLHQPSTAAKTATPGPTQPTAAAGKPASALDSLLGDMMPAPAPSMASMTSKSKASSSMSAQPPHTAAVLEPKVAQVPETAAAAQGSDPPATAADEDPFALFGGPPPSFSISTSKAASAAPLTSVDDGFLAGFAAPVPVVQRQQSAAAAPVSSSSPGTSPTVSDFGDFQAPAHRSRAGAGGTCETPAVALQGPRAAGAAASQMPPPRIDAADPFAGAPHEAGLTSQHAGKGSHFVALAPLSAASGATGAAGAASPTSTFGYERRPNGVGSVDGTPSRYRVFDCLDQAEEGSSKGSPSSAAAAAAGAVGLEGQQQQPGSGGGGMLDASSHPERPLDSVAEVGHKAARMLQSGTKWFMRAGKNLVKQVQSNLHQHPVGSTSTSSAGSGGSTAGRSGETPPFYYNWAAQLSRLSPNSRAAAMGALPEDDRLVVQRIMDEAALGDSYMESAEYEGYAKPGRGPGSTSAQLPAAGRPQQQRQQQQHHEEAGGSSKHSRPLSHTSLAAAAGAEEPPPSYEELCSSQLSSVQQQQHGSPTGTQEAGVAIPAAATPVAHSGDLLGGVGAGASSGSKPAPGPAQAAEEDLLGLSSGTANTPASAAAAIPAPTSAHIEEMFTVPKPSTDSAASRMPPRPRPAPATPAAAAAARPQGTAPASGSCSSSQSALDSMIDLGAGLAAVDTAGFDELYADPESAAVDPNEPELRRQARTRRIAEKHARMAAQLAEKRARDEAEAAEKAGKVELRESLRPRIEAWKAGKKDNIRALLASLHTVLWEGSGWSQPSMADMVDNTRVKRFYMKANLVVHPDKVKQKGGTLEQVATADMVFDVLKSAWGKFEAASY